MLLLIVILGHLFLHNSINAGFACSKRILYMLVISYELFRLLLGIFGNKFELFIISWGL